MRPVTSIARIICKDAKHWSYLPRYGLLPVSGLVKDVVAVSADTLAAEQGWEATAWGNKLLWDPDFLLGLGLTDDKLANL
jgi:hypothetical protein